MATKTAAKKTGTSKKPQKNQYDIFIDTQYQALDNKIKGAILFIAFLVPLVLFWFLLFSPKQKEEERLKAEIPRVQADIDKAMIVINKKAEFEADLEETRKKFEETLVMLPTTQEIPDLLRTISDLGKAAGLEFLSFVPSREIQRDFYADIPIYIKVRGPYHSVGKFLDQVSKLDRIVTTNTVRMGGPRQDGGEVLLDSDCGLVTYRFTGLK